MLTKENTIRALFLVAFVIIGLFYISLPAQVPIHYDGTGTPGNYQAKEILSVILIISNIFFYSVGLFFRKGGSGEMADKFFRLRLIFTLMALGVVLLFMLPPFYPAIRPLIFYMVMGLVLYFLGYLMMNQQYFKAN